MDFALVFSLMLAFLSTGQTFNGVTEQNLDSCYEKCLPGYHKVGDCGHPVAKLRCERCGNGTFTHLPNAVKKCTRCDTCGNYEGEIKPFPLNHKGASVRKKGYYNASSSSTQRVCLPCKCQDCQNPDNYSDNKKKCPSCQRKECLEFRECKSKCTTTTFPLSTTQSTAATPSASTTTAARTTTSNQPSNPIMNPVPDNSVNEMVWLFLVVFLVTLLVFLLLLLLFGSCLCWRAKNLEPSVECPKFNEQSNHQGGSPNTLTFNISEETPMMTQSPAAPEHPAHVSPVDGEHKAARQDEQSEHWPAIVLYAIIKEVPLRRWKEFLRLLSVADQQLERVELEAGFGLGSMERQYQMLRLWSQRSSASLDDVFSALHYMDLSGCAQLLQESLEKLQWRPEVKQGFTACRSYTDPGFNEAMQDT